MHSSKLIALRNDVDQLEQRVEPVRQAVGEGVFQRFSVIDHQALEQTVRCLQAAVDRANKAKQLFVTRVIWPFIRNRRFGQLVEVGRAFQGTAVDIGLPIPEVEVDATTVSQWIQYGDLLADRVSQVVTAHDYFAKLAALTQSRPLEELSKQWKSLTEDLGTNSELLWQAWLRLQPSRMSLEQRKLLGDYSAFFLQIIVSAHEQSQQVGRDEFRWYYQLLPQISFIFPCWAVTSLSARRVPFDPAFFDLLVIDEASQCDIASALPLLYRARRVVVIGDPMQLRHISTLSKRQDQQLLSKHHLVDEYPGWAYSTRSVFDIASSLCRSEDIVALRDHHRSHADIIEFSNEVFDQGRLRVATRYDRLRGRTMTSLPFVGLTFRVRRFARVAGGAVNETEAQAVVEEIARLVGQGYRGSIGVVSPFRRKLTVYAIWLCKWTSYLCDWQTQISCLTPCTASREMNGM